MRPFSRQTLALVAFTLLALPGITDATLAHQQAPLAVWDPVSSTARLGPHDASAQDDVTLTVVGVESAFAPETYKGDDRFNSRNDDDARNQTTNWDTALGHRISFLVRVEAGDQPLTCSTRFVAEAYIDAIQGRLHGWTNGSFATDVPGAPTDICTTGLPGVRLYNLTFDLDGAPDSLLGRGLPALSDGVYTVTFNLYHQVTPSATNTAGQGPEAGSLQIGFRIANPQLSLPESFLSFPESTLRMWSDVGAAAGLNKDQYLMPRAPLTPSTSTNLTINFAAAPVGATFHRTDWFATRIGTSPLPGTATPDLPGDFLAGQVDDQADRAPLISVDSVRYDIPNNTVPSSRAVMMEVRGADFTTRHLTIGGVDIESGPPHVPLHIIAITLSADDQNWVTGVGSYVQPVTERTFPIRSIEVLNAADPRGATGITRVSLLDAQSITGGASGTDAGDLFLLPVSLNHTLVPLSRMPNEPWITGELSHAAFPPVAGYTMLAMMYGTNDAFLGMTLARRGIEMALSGPRLVEGQSGTVQLTVTNLADDHDGVQAEQDLTIDVSIRATGFPDGGTFNTTVRDLREGQSVIVPVDVIAGTPGALTLKFLATSGELRIEDQPITLEVISRRQADREDRRWYELPADGMPLVALTLLGLAALARRRRD